MYYMMTYLCFFAFAPTAHLAPIAALTVFVFGTFGIVIPSPGGMGTYHVLATAALVIHGVNSNDAFSFANIMFFSIQIKLLIQYINKTTQFNPKNNIKLIIYASIKAITKYHKFYFFFGATFVAPVVGFAPVPAPFVFSN